MVRETRLLHKTKIKIKREASGALLHLSHQLEAGEGSPHLDDPTSLSAFATLGTTALTSSATFITLLLVGI